MYYYSIYYDIYKFPIAIVLYKFIIIKRCKIRVCGSAVCQRKLCTFTIVA